MERLRIFKQLVQYLWGRKKFWLIPMVIVFVLMGIILVISESTIVGSFIYTLF